MSTPIEIVSDVGMGALSLAGKAADIAEEKPVPIKKILQEKADLAQDRQQMQEAAIRQGAKPNTNAPPVQTLGDPKREVAEQAGESIRDNALRATLFDRLNEVDPTDPRPVHIKPESKPIIKKAYEQGMFKAAEEMGMEKEAILGLAWQGIKGVGRGLGWLGRKVGWSGTKTKGWTGRQLSRMGGNPGKNWSYQGIKGGKHMYNKQGYWPRQSRLSKGLHVGSAGLLAGAYGLNKGINRYNKAMTDRGNLKFKPGKPNYRVARQASKAYEY